MATMDMQSDATLMKPAVKSRHGVVKKTVLLYCFQWPPWHLACSGWCGFCSPR
ncbi:Uncharacterised protein [Yersinia kristensenii]|nr:Uncharacterised protein [Yersinia kristensenii]